MLAEGVKMCFHVGGNDFKTSAAASLHQGAAGWMTQSGGCVYI